MARRVHVAHSYLSAPLDHILGTQSHVRILRVLTEYEHPLPPGELAREARLDLSGVLRALEGLEDTGIVQSLGVGRGRVIQLNEHHFFTPVVRQVFDAERARWQKLFAELQRVMRSSDPVPRAAWIEGPHAIRQDTARDPLRVGVLVNVRDRHAIREALTKRLHVLERDFDLTIDLVLRTAADLEALGSDEVKTPGDVLPIYGVAPVDLMHPGRRRSADEPPRSWRTAGTDRERARSGERDDRTGVGASGPRTHAELDLISRRIAEATAHALKHDPRIVERAKRWIAHRFPEASEAERHELREWEHILAMPSHRLRAFLLDPGERATRLRQSSPFLAVLSPAERKRLVSIGAEEPVEQRERRERRT